MLDACLLILSFHVAQLFWALLLFHSSFPTSVVVFHVYQGHEKDELQCQAQLLRFTDRVPWLRLRVDMLLSAIYTRKSSTYICVPFFTRED
jgi:hypothetical protein